MIDDSCIHVSLNIHKDTISVSASPFRAARIRCCQVRFAITASSLRRLDPAFQSVMSFWNKTGPCQDTACIARLWRRVKHSRGGGSRT